MASTTVYIVILLVLCLMIFVIWAVCAYKIVRDVAAQGSNCVLVHINHVVEKRLNAHVYNYEQAMSTALEQHSLAFIKSWKHEITHLDLQPLDYQERLDEKIQYLFNTFVDILKGQSGVLEQLTQEVFDNIYPDFKKKYNDYCSNPSQKKNACFRHLVLCANPFIEKWVFRFMFNRALKKVRKCHDETMKLEDTSPMAKDLKSPNSSRPAFLEDALRDSSWQSLKVKFNRLRTFLLHIGMLYVTHENNANALDRMEKRVLTVMKSTLETCVQEAAKKWSSIALEQCQDYASKKCSDLMNSEGGRPEWLDELLESRPAMGIIEISSTLSLNHLNCVSVNWIEQFVSSLVMCFRDARVRDIRSVVASEEALWTLLLSFIRDSLPNTEDVRVMARDVARRNITEELYKIVNERTHHITAAHERWVEYPSKFGTTSPMNQRSPMDTQCSPGVSPNLQTPSRTSPCSTTSTYCSTSTQPDCAAVYGAWRHEWHNLREQMIALSDETEKKLVEFAFGHIPLKLNEGFVAEVRGRLRSLAEAIKLCKRIFNQHETIVSLSQCTLSSAQSGECAALNVADLFHEQAKCVSRLQQEFPEYAKVMNTALMLKEESAAMECR